MNQDEPTLIQNAVFIPEDGVYLVSSPADPDEVVGHILTKDGLTLSISGGHSYAKRDDDFIKLGTQDRYEEWTLTTHDPFAIVANKLLLMQPWRDETTGKAGPWRYRPMKEMGIVALRKLFLSPEQLGRPDWRLVQTVAKHWVERKAEALVATVRELHSPDRT